MVFQVGLCVNIRNVPWFDSMDPDSFLMMTFNNGVSGWTVCKVVNIRNVPWFDSMDPGSFLMMTFNNGVSGWTVCKHP